ncbi:MAG: hypothetical protein JSW07_14875 [bacterium]|nr:MAG: hypothetical protein JSW07_14875 [bacterium]
MRAILIISIINLLFSIRVPSATAQAKWRFELMTGDAFCFKTPLTIKQSGYEDISLKAKYETNSFKLPIYYSVRIAKWKNQRAWELEFVHLKIKLKDNPPEIERFEISHGFNLYYVNRCWNYKTFILRLGAGIVFAHPENTVRGKSLDQSKGILNMGYYIAGPTFQLTLCRKFGLWQNLRFLIEGKVTASYARVPVFHGHANVTNVAIHGLAGLGYEF